MTPSYDTPLSSLLEYSEEGGKKAVYTVQYEQKINISMFMTEDLTE